jgi:hypothetical protein
VLLSTQLSITLRRLRQHTPTSVLKGRSAHLYGALRGNRQISRATFCAKTHAISQGGSHAAAKPSPTPATPALQS